MFQLKIVSHSFEQEGSADEVKHSVIHALRGKGMVFVPASDSEYGVESQNFMFIKHKGVFKFSVVNNSLKAEFFLSLESVFKISIFVFLLFAFFSAFSIQAYLIASFTVSVVLFLLVVFYMNNHFYRVFNLFKVGNDTAEILTEMQMKWIQDPNLCSACGAQVSKYHTFCCDCGIKVGEPKPFSRFSSTDSSLNKNYMYLKK
ncbi:MAG: hypothetical protein IPO21_09420 [Bacteroidales bacterium]|nr:hypothetical protein [Bacteroidales bacterium]